MKGTNARLLVATLTLAGCGVQTDDTAAETGSEDTSSMATGPSTTDSDTSSESEESGDADSETTETIETTDETETETGADTMSGEETETGGETETGSEDCLDGELDCECSLDSDCIDGLFCIGAVCAEPACGDGVEHGEEACDDGNLVDSDGCNANCEDTRVVAIDAGGQHTCALLNSGDVKCWGRSNYGQLGQGNDSIIGDGETPATVPVIQLGAKAVEIRTGDSHSCALLEDGEVMCWGYGPTGALGYGNNLTIGDDELPIDAGTVNTGGVVVQLSLGGYRSCALLDSGYVACWGNGASCQTTIGDNETPGSEPVWDLGDEIEQVITGSTHTCALRSDEDLICWGNNSSGKLGVTSNSSTQCPTSNPTPLVPLPLVLQYDLSTHHTCAIIEQTGQLTCWGRGSYGALGYANTQHVGGLGAAVSNFVVDLGQEIPIQVSTGDYHTCVVLEGGEVMCWGTGTYGRLGYGNTTTIGDTEHPSTAGFVDIGGPAQAVAAGLEHTCALRTDGEVVCWGRSNYGQLGYGSPSTIGDDELPVTAGNVSVF